jgi:hypothetical protein
MASLSSTLRVRFGRLWRNDAPLTATATCMLVLLVGFALGLVLDPRIVTGAPVWLKPAKFAASIAAYALTLAWLFGYLPSFARTRRSVSWGTSAALWVEMAIIVFQAARGTTSHFNVSTPLNAALFATMGIVIVTQTLSTVAVAIALFRQSFEDRALGWAARLGLLLTIAGALIGGIMTTPTETQLAEMRGGQLMLSGAHTVGAPDGGPGMPITGWSREHGDVRIPHFIGLHALQLLPLFALWLRRSRASIAQRVRLVFALAASQLTLMGLLLVQALRGISLFSQEPSMVSGLLLWLVFSGLLVWGALSPRVASNSVTLSAS